MAKTPKQMAALAKRKAAPAPTKTGTGGTHAAKPLAADPAEVAEYCLTNGAPQLASELIRDKATMDVVMARVGAIQQILTLTRIARSTGCDIDKGFEKNAIARGLSVEQVRALLFEELNTKQSPEIRGNLSAGNLTRAGALIDQGWDRAIKNVNAKQARQS